MKYKMFFSFLALTIGLMGCGGDDAATGGTQADLTQDQADAVASAVTQVAAASGVPGMPAVRMDLNGYDGRMDPRGFTVDATTVPCPVSGSATVSGTYDGSYVEPDFNYNYDIAAAYDACTATADDGEDYTLDGNLDTAGDLSATINTTDYTSSGEITQTTSGTIDISGGGLDITDCVVTMTTHFSWTPSSFSGTWTGTICGNAMNGDINFSS